MEARDPKVSVSMVIVSWNSGADLLRCLESLSHNPPGCAWEAIVVDNNSTDSSIDAARERAPWARFLINPENRGLAAANNQGMFASTGQFILLANADVAFTPGAIDALIDVCERHPRAGVVVPQLLQPDGHCQVSVGSLPTLREAAFRMKPRYRGNASGLVDAGFWWSGWAHDQERQIGHGAEAAYLVRRAAVTEVGAQDEHFELDWEGVDWSARMADLGWEVWFTPTARMQHAGGSSIRQVPLRWIVSSHRGMFRYFRTRVPRRAVPLVLLTIALRAAVKAATYGIGRTHYESARRRARLRSGSG
jgi:N-acetylglucosaminyl-diphospho-decaprenol L-rhamnosyltransferase